MACAPGTIWISPGPIDERVDEPATARQHVAQIVARRQTAQEVEVRQADVGIDHHDPLADFRQRDRQVQDQVRRADAPLAAGEEQRSTSAVASAMSIR